MKWLLRNYRAPILLLITFLTTSGCGNSNTSTLVNSSLNGVEIQEKIWLTKESGDTNTSNQLQSTLSNILTQGKCNQTTAVLSGVTPKVVLTCDQGVGAIVKVKQIPFPFEEPTARNENSGLPLLSGFPLSDGNAEMAAYAIDSLLQLNVVPTTLHRALPGVGVGSIQYFVKNTTLTPMDLTITGFRKMLILDYIINNSDRHSGNWLYLASSNRIVAIDNGRAFRDETTPPAPPPGLNTVLIYLQSESALTQNLKNISDVQIATALNPYLRNYLIAKVQTRIRNIQSNF